MNNNDDAMDEAEREEQRYAQASRRRGDYGDCDPVAAERPEPGGLVERWLVSKAEREAELEDQREAYLRSRW